MSSGGGTLVLGGVVSSNPVGGGGGVEAPPVREHQQPPPHQKQHHHHRHHGRKSKKQRRREKKKKNETDDYYDDSGVLSIGDPLGTQFGGSAEQVRPVACHLDEYLERKINKYVAKRAMSREEAVRAALLKAQAKRWPVLDADCGYGHGVVLGALETGAAMELDLGGSVLLRSAGSARRCTDDELRIRFGCDAPSVASVPMRGKYALRCGGSSAAEATGVYDLASRGLKPGAGPHLVPFHLHRDRRSTSIASFGLPHALVHATVEPNDDGRTARILDAELVVRLRPSAPALLDPRPAIPCAATPSRPVLEPTRLLVGYASEEERAAAQCALRPVGIDQVVRRIFEGRLGADPSVTYRFCSHVGSSPACGVGRTAESDRDFYRLGHASELLVTVALLRHVQSSSESGSDMHDPKLTKRLLKASGAVNVYRGLKQCYAAFGRGNVPTPYDLANHTSGLPAHVDADVQELLGEVLKGCGGDSAALGPASADPVQLERSLGKRLAKRVRPLYAPGGEYHHSFLGFAVLRYMLPDWRGSAHGSSYVVKCAGELGMTTACYPAASPEAIAHAPCCPIPTKTPCAPSVPGEADAPLYAASLGLSCRVDEVAAFLAASGPSAQHSWTRSPPGRRHEGSVAYSFLPDMLQPRTCIDRKNMIYHGRAASFFSPILRFFCI